jgi:ABC-type tungstate transport system substrate-binding protein
VSLDPLVLEIVLRSLHVTVGALIFSTVIGVPVGTWFALTHFPGNLILSALFL